MAYLVWTVLSLVLVETCGGETVVPKEKANFGTDSSASVGDSLFQERERLFSAEYSSVGLTYRTNDLGAEDYRWPSPVALSPQNGMWVVDSGEDRVSWRMIHVNLQGERVFTSDLNAHLELDAPSEFYPYEMRVSADGTAQLLASRRVKSGEEGQKKYGDYVVATFSCAGELTKVVNLPVEFQYDGKTFVTEAGKVINKQENRPSATWQLYASTGEPIHSVETVPGVRPLAVANGILERRSEEEFRYLSTDGEVVSVPLKNGVSESEQYVSGTGNFFGYLAHGSYDTVGGGAVEKDRQLHLMYYDSRRQVAYSLGETSLAPAQFQGQGTSPFTVYFAEQARFGKEGNFYEIAWSSSELTVYRYPLNREYVDEKLRELRGTEK
jgi:hypothetical protein